MPVYLADPKGFPRFPEADLNMKERLTQLLSLLAAALSLALKAAAVQVGRKAGQVPKQSISYKPSHRTAPHSGKGLG